MDACESAQWRAGSKLLAFSALMMGTAAGAYAQQPGSASSPSVGTPESAIADIVVTAQKRSQILIDVPLSITVLPAETLRNNSIQEMRQLVQISPSVSFSEGQAERGASFTMRGISSTAQEGGIQPSVALVVDGVPIARQGEFISTFTDIAQIEVLAGPQGTLFGKNATAGVINIVTKAPTDRFEGSIEADYTTDDEKILRGTLNIPVTDRIRARFNAYVDHLPGIVKNIGPGRDIASNKSYGFMGKVAFDLSDDVDLLLSADYRRRDNGFGFNMVIVPRLGAAGILQQQVSGITYRRGLMVASSDSDTRSESRGWSAAGTLNWTLSDALTLTSISAYREYRFDNVTDVDVGPAGWNAGRGFSPNPLNYPVLYVNREFPRQPSDAHYGSQELRVAYRGNGIDFVAGGFFQSYHEDMAGSTPLIIGSTYLDASRYSATYRNRSYAVFADATMDLTSEISMFGGLRHTWEKTGADYLRRPFLNIPVSRFDPVTGVVSGPPSATFTYDADRHDRNVSGRIGLRFKPTNGSTYYVSYSRGYKGPATDVSSAWSPGLSVFADPEKADAVEAGTKQSMMGGRFYMSASIYYQKVRNVQQVTNTNGTTSQLQAAGNIRSYGAEVQIDARLTDGLTMRGGVAYTNARYVGGGIAPCNLSQTARGAPGCDLDRNRDGIRESQSLNGNIAKEQPELVLTLGLNHKQPVSDHLQIIGNVNYTYRSKVQYQLIDDPLTLEPAHSQLDVSLGIADLDQNWSLTAYVKNLTNDFYYGNLGSTNALIAASWGRIARDSRRYGGIGATFKF